MNHTKRCELIINLIKQRGFMSIDDLVEECNVTPQTIRRDLNQLSESGIISRYHGGAGIVTSWENTPYQDRKTHNKKVKERIADAIVKMIPDGASIFINIGTTTEMVASKLLNHRNLSAKEDFSVIIAAGEVRYRDGGIIGEATCDFISQFRLDYGIIGISGISADGALLDFDFREVKVSQAILKNSKNVILAADSTKFERCAMVEQGHLSQVDFLVSDEDPPSSIQKVIKENSITFVKV